MTLIVVIINSLEECLELKTKDINLWIKKIIILIISLVLVILVSNLHSIKSVKKDISLEEFLVHIDNKISKLMKVYDIPGVNIALVKEGKNIWSKSYGYADLETGRKMTTDTYLSVQSISKPVTAWGIMKLVEQGKIDLDTPVEQYMKTWQFPESKFSKEKITVRHLLNHSAGLPIGNFFNMYSPNEKVPSLKDSLSNEVILFQEPGLKFFYSNVGFNLLELLIEEVTGREFSQYMEEEVLIPLGMDNSTFNWNENLKPAVPIGYDLTGKTVPVYIYPEKGSGGLFASVNDIATFIVAGMPIYSKTNQVINSASINTLYTSTIDGLGMYGFVFDSYGFGYYREDLINNKYAVSHGGQGAGVMTHFHSIPETGDGIVILTNSQRSWPFIAYILSDWAKWNGFSSIGMSKIIYSKYILWTSIGLIWSILLLKIWKFIEDIIMKRRLFNPWSKKYLKFRVIQLILSVILIGILLWCINQPYLFISSIFPIASFWLGISVFILAVVLLLFMLFPRED